MVRILFTSPISVQLRVFGFVNDTHAAAAELLEYPVMRNDIADHGACLNIYRLVLQRGAAEHRLAAERSVEGVQREGQQQNQPC